MTPELKLVAGCCRWPADAQSHIHSLAMAVSDWHHVAALTRAHRVEGLVWHALRAVEAVPSAVAVELSRMADDVRVEGIRAIGEALRVGGAVAAQGIPYLVVKGLPLAMLAYGTATIKNSIDLDLLVRAEDAVRTAAVLSGLGYQTLRPPRPLDGAEFARWSAVAKEAWMVSDRGQVDLHWDLLDQPDLLAGVDPWPGQRSVALLPGHDLPTLSDPVHLTYLAAHGAMSGWSRLKWLADFAAFIRARPPGEREGLCDEARRIGNSYCLDQGLILAERLLGPSVVPPAIADAGSLELADLAERLILLREPNRVLEKSRAGARLMGRMQWRLRGGSHYKWSEARRRFRDQEIRFRLKWPLTRHSQWVYFPLRMVGAMFSGIYSFVRAPRSES